MKRLTVIGALLLLTLLSACGGGPDPAEQAAEHFTAGRRLMDTGDYQQAIASFNEALALNPDLATAYTMRGISRWEIVDGAADQIGEAMADFDRALELDSDQFQSRYHRAQGYSMLGRYAEAVSEFEIALGAAANMDTQVDIAYRRGLALKELGRFDDARLALETALAISQNSEVTARIKQALESLDNAD